MLQTLRSVYRKVEYTPLGVTICTVGLVIFTLMVLWLDLEYQAHFPAWLMALAYLPYLAIMLCWVWRKAGQ